MESFFGELAVPARIAIVDVVEFFSANFLQQELCTLVNADWPRVAPANLMLYQRAFNPHARVSIKGAKVFEHVIRRTHRRRGSLCRFCLHLLPDGVLMGYSNPVTGFGFYGFKAEIYTHLATHTIETVIGLPCDDRGTHWSALKMNAGDGVSTYRDLREILSTRRVICPTTFSTRFPSHRHNQAYAEAEPTIFLARSCNTTRRFPVLRAKRAH